MRNVLLAALVSAALPSSASSGDATPPVPVLVELFTSEGCSSCPPADEELARLLESQPVAGARIIALSEHVDYWDDLGWRDPFSSARCTARQQRYSARFGLAGVYTPQLVVAGEVQVVGSDAGAAREAVAAAARRARGTITLRLAGDRPGRPALTIQATWPATPAEIVVALAQDRATSRVERGENAGRVLHHVASARSIATVGEGSGSYRGIVPLDLSALRGPAHAVVFVQELGGHRVLAANAIALTQ